MPTRRSGRSSTPQRRGPSAASTDSRRGARSPPASWLVVAATSGWPAGTCAAAAEVAARWRLAPIIAATRQALGELEREHHRARLSRREVEVLELVAAGSYGAADRRHTRRRREHGGDPRQLGADEARGAHPDAGRLDDLRPERAMRRRPMIRFVGEDPAFASGSSMPTRRDPRASILARWDDRPRRRRLPRRGVGRAARPRSRCRRRRRAAAWLTRPSSSTPPSAWPTSAHRRRRSSHAISRSCSTCWPLGTP